MSKIKNGGLDQYGPEPFEQQQFGTAVEGVNTYLPKKTLRELDHAHLGQFVITGLLKAGGKTPVYPAVGKQGASHLCLGASNSSVGADNKEDYSVFLCVIKRCY